jgi:hypothetical protein
VNTFAFLKDVAGHFSCPKGIAAMSTVKIPPQSEKSGTKSRIGRQNWFQFILPLGNLVAVVLLLVAIKWDRYEKAERLEHLKLQLNQIESQLKEMELQVDKVKLPTGAKQLAPGTTKPPERAQQGDQLHPASAP